MMYTHDIWYIHIDSLSSVAFHVIYISASIRIIKNHMNSRLVVFKVLGISRKQLGFGSWKACLGCDYTLNHFALCPLRWFYSLNNYHSTNKHFNIHNWTIWVWTCLDLNLTLEASVDVFFIQLSSGASCERLFLSQGSISDPIHLRTDACKLEST